jgi:hypothetical protein
MESNENKIRNDELSKDKLINVNQLIMTREEFNHKNEEHILSLRKKTNNRQAEYLKKFNLHPKILSHEIDINNLIPLIQNEPLYIQYNSNINETEKLNCLLQMLISENNNILKYCLIELKKYLNHIDNPNAFLSKNLLNIFNEKMFRFLFTKLLNNKNNYTNDEDYYQIMTLLCFNISKLCFLNEFYIDILYDYIPNILNIAQNEQDKNLKNSLYIITNKILLKDKKKLETIYQTFFNQIYNELINIINESMTNKNIFILKDLYPTLINIINIFILINIKNSDNNIFLIDIQKISKILLLVKEYLDKSFMETEILKSTLNFLGIVLKNYKANKNNYNIESEKEFRQIINGIRLNNHIITYIYDNSINNNDFRYEIIEIINNMLLLNDSEFLNNLIENNICEQISNLQDYLLENDNNNNHLIKLLYESHIDLIYNLVSTQSINAIQSICIDNSCISNLFLFINNSTFLYNNDNLKVIKIFDFIIESKTEYVHSLLLTEGIYDLYKNILNNSKDNNLLLIIFKDLSIMIERGKDIKTSNGINLVSNHFMKNGILDLINNIKGRSDLNNEIIFLLDEIPKLLEEKTK